MQYLEVAGNVLDAGPYTTQRKKPTDKIYDTVLKLLAVYVLATLASTLLVTFFMERI